ncbi:hypothetical protein [Actinomadura violacea]|uniref:Uncharacterized protein n=1 Tax=Actinomadura violacea TaxID=2819934 RepID=A0ABS3RT86_9ACTN|nr:hypothetical protein [Actinomadura violacea]MBO2459249.1 hypothetical protein [Actinomadura violacea]
MMTSSGPGLAAELEALADLAHDLGRAAVVVVPELTPDEMGDAAHWVQEVIGYMGEVLRHVVVRAEGLRQEWVDGERARPGEAASESPAVALMDTALVHLGIGEHAVEVAHHLVLTGRAHLWEALGQQEHPERMHSR